MNVGMMWLDDDKRRPFEEKVRRAADYYHEKYGRMPDLCMVNSSLDGCLPSVGKIEVKQIETVLPDHFWLGVKA